MMLIISAPCDQVLPPVGHTISNLFHPRRVKMVRLQKKSKWNNEEDDVECDSYIGSLASRTFTGQECFIKAGWIGSWICVRKHFFSCLFWAGARPIRDPAACLFPPNRFTLADKVRQTRLFRVDTFAFIRHNFVLDILWVTIIHIIHIKDHELKTYLKKGLCPLTDMDCTAMCFLKTNKMINIFEIISFPPHRYVSLVLNTGSLAVTVACFLLW